jgi:tetratricopeptide (TPR) repeat protein
MLAKYPAEKSINTLSVLAGYQRRAGRLDAAKANLAEAVKLPATDPETQVDLARALSDTGQVDQAIRILRNLASKDPNNPAYDLELADKLRISGHNEEAIKIFESLLKRFGENEEIVGRVRSMLSVIYVDMGNYAKGEAELELLLKRDPDDAGPNNDLGYLYADQGKNLEKAEAMIRKAVAEDSDNYAYLDSLGWVLFKRGKFQEARTPLEKAQADPRSDSTIPDHLGDVYFQLQEHAKAKAAWERALKIASEVKPTDKRLAEIQKKLKSLQQFVPSPKPKTGDTP